jgi:hypothetical protein
MQNYYGIESESKQSDPYKIKDTPATKVTGVFPPFM